MEYLETLQRKTIKKTYNRLIRYKKRLIREGIELIKKGELEIKVKEDRGIRLINSSPTIWVGKNETDFSEMIELSKRRIPSLHRRYYQGISKMKKILEEN